jgi:hypothetical protein
MRGKTCALALLLVLCAPLAAGAHSGPAADGAVDNAKATHEHHQHGGDSGHLPASSQNVRLVGKAATNQDFQGRVADSAVFDGYAYLAAFWEPTCQKGGVYVFDVNDPTKPKQINFIRTANDTYVGEGVQVIHIDTPAFEGDVLAYNNEICNDDKGDEKHPNGGMTLVDVTNPKVHKYLVEHFGDFQPDGDAHEIHSVFIWDAGDRAYAVLVDNEEATDVDIVEITDPRNPVLIAEYDLATLFPFILQPGQELDAVFHHDMVVKRIAGRWLMLVSYWDAGYVVLDVTNPAAATYVADSDFANPDPEAAESGLTVRPEGNGHEAEFTLDNQYIVAADEDFNPYKGVATNVDDGTTFTAIQGSNVPGVPQGGSIDGDTVYVGQACDADTAVPPAGGPDKIAVVARGVCTFQEKYDNVVAAGGYEALLVANRENAGLGDGCDTLISMLVSGDTLPAFFIQRRVGFDLFDIPYNHATCVAGSDTHLPGVAVGTSGDDVSLESIFDGWGYVHLYRNQAGKLPELDTYAIPQAHDEAFASGFGDLSVHEAITSIVDPTLVYFAYYAGGFRVARITPTEDLQEVGHFIDDGGNNFWGGQAYIHEGDEYVLVSDRDFGLYIFEYTGP